MTPDGSGLRHSPPPLSCIRVGDGNSRGRRPVYPLISTSNPPLLPTPTSTSLLVSPPGPNPKCDVKK